VPSSLIETSRSKQAWGARSLNWARYWNRSDAKLFQAWLDDLKGWSTKDFLQTDWTDMGRLFSIQHSDAFLHPCCEVLPFEKINTCRVGSRQKLFPLALCVSYKRLSPVSTICVYSKYLKMTCQIKELPLLELCWNDFEPLQENQLSWSWLKYVQIKSADHFYESTVTLVTLW